MNKTFIQDESGHLVEKRDPSLIEPLSPTMGENIYLQIQDNIVINCAVPPEILHRGESGEHSRVKRQEWLRGLMLDYCPPPRNFGELFNQHELKQRIETQQKINKSDIQDAVFEEIRK